VDTDKPAETASDFYRFQLKVAPNKTETQTVTEERVFAQTISLSNLDDNNIRHFISQAVASEKVKAGLKTAMELRLAKAKTQLDIKELDRQLKTLTEDQGRLRANLREVPSNSEIAQRYLKKLNEQETTIEKYQAELKSLQTTEHNQTKEFDQFLANFSAE
jgi:hypothetical protein